MKSFKFLPLAVLIALLGISGSLFAQERKGCEVKATVEVESMPGNDGAKKATVKLEDGAAPLKYIFYEEISGRLLQKDFSKNSANDLGKGSYYCIVIDNNGCTKKIQFQIQ